ncbi:hypothetical protein HK101_010659 [Irineochytrium annulatum]|nr:hypothetical protein HK101_010659 [Irineochytrium annulatum]
MMIQCERCDVWQHMSCMLVVKAPKNYYCELCRPDKHRELLKKLNKERGIGVKKESSKTSASKATPKKRKTMNSLSSTQQLSEILPIIDDTEEKTKAGASSGSESPDEDVDAKPPSPKLPTTRRGSRSTSAATIVAKPTTAVPSKSSKLTKPASTKPPAAVKKESSSSRPSRGGGKQSSVEAVNTAEAVPASETDSRPVTRRRGSTATENNITPAELPPVRATKRKHEDSGPPARLTKTRRGSAKTAGASGNNSGGEERDDPTTPTEDALDLGGGKGGLVGAAGNGKNATDEKGTGSRSASDEEGCKVHEDPNVDADMANAKDADLRSGKGNPVAPVTGKRTRGSSGEDDAEEQDDSALPVEKRKKSSAPSTATNAAPVRKQKRRKAPIKKKKPSASAAAAAAEKSGRRTTRSEYVDPDLRPSEPMPLEPGMTLPDMFARIEHIKGYVARRLCDVREDLRAGQTDPGRMIYPPRMGGFALFVLMMDAAGHVKLTEDEGEEMDRDEMKVRRIDEERAAFARIRAKAAGKVRRKEGRRERQAKDEIEMIEPPGRAREYREVMARALEGRVRELEQKGEVARIDLAVVKKAGEIKPKDGAEMKTKEGEDGKKTNTKKKVKKGAKVDRMDVDGEGKIGELKKKVKKTTKKVVVDVTADGTIKDSVPSPATAVMAINATTAIVQAAIASPTMQSPTTPSSLPVSAVPSAFSVITVASTAPSSDLHLPVSDGAPLPAALLSSESPSLATAGRRGSVDVPAAATSAALATATAAKGKHLKKKALAAAATSTTGSAKSTAVMEALLALRAQRDNLGRPRTAEECLVAMQQKMDLFKQLFGDRMPPGM